MASFAHVAARGAARGRSIAASFPLLPEAAALVAILLYLPTLGFGYVFDDLALLDASGFPVALGGAIPYRPLRYASHALDGMLGGSAALAHAHNAALHGLVAALVARIAVALGASGLAACLGASLAACHPLAVEAVAYVSGRRDLLSVALGLVAVLVALPAARDVRMRARPRVREADLPAGADNRMRARPAYALGVVLAAVAAKEGGLLFLVPVAACLGAAARDPRTRRRALVATFAVGAAGAATAAAYGAVGPLLPPPDLAGLGLPARTAAHYASSLLAPLALAPDYPHLRAWVASVRSGELASGLGWACATLALVAAGLAAGFGAARRLAASGPGGAAVAFVAIWGVVFAAAVATWGGLHEPGADRHAYLLLPVSGVAAALGLTRASGRRGGGAAAFAVAAALVVAECSVSLSAMDAWRDERSLWSHAVVASPRSARAHANLARILAIDGRYGAATRHLNRSLELDEGVAHTWMGRAALRCAKGHPVAARLDLVRALERGADPGAVAAIGRECPLPEFQSDHAVAATPMAPPIAGPAATHTRSPIATQAAILTETPS